MDPRLVHLALALKTGFPGVPLTYWTHHPVDPNLPFTRLLSRVQHFFGPDAIAWMRRARTEIADATLAFGLMDIEPPHLLNGVGKPIYMGQAMVMDLQRGQDRLVLADIPLHDP